MRPGGDLAALGDRHPLAGDPRVLHDERGELARGPFGLDPAQLVGAGEVLVERADPAQARGDRVGLRADVVPVQRVADLEAQRVAGAEARGLRAALEHGVPERNGILVHHHQLDAGLARVAGAVDHALDAVDLAHGEREGRRLVEPEALE